MVLGTGYRGKVKTSHWKCLPWLLAGLALPDEEQARSIGRRCIKLFEDASDMSPMATYGRKHEMSRRFLDYNFQHCSLRASLDEFLAGACRKDLDTFCQWCGALRLMKTTEQPTEGLHRSLKQLLSRAPHAGPSFLSTESRLPMFAKYFSSPQSLALLAHENEDLSTHRTLVIAVAHLVGGNQCEPSSEIGVSHPEAVKLLYHTSFKYDMGQQTALVLPTSDAQQLRVNKYFDCIQKSKT